MDSLESTAGTDTLKEMLEEWWEVTDRKSALETISWLLNEGQHAGADPALAEIRQRGIEAITEEEKADEDSKIGDAFTIAEFVMGVNETTEADLPETVLAWDLVRAVNMARWAFICGYINEDEMWEAIRTTAGIAKESFSSWEEYGNSFAWDAEYGEAKQMTTRLRMKSWERFSIKKIPLGRQSNGRIQKNRINNILKFYDYGTFQKCSNRMGETMTENDLDQMEAQGLDVSKYREKLAARRAKEAEEAKRDRELYKNPTQLDKMKPYMQTPRSSETEFFKKLAGKAPWLGKSKWLRKFTEGYIVYAGIVSAPAEAWKGVKHKDDSFHGIGIYALDKGRHERYGWLKRVMEKLRNMCEGRQPVAPGCEGVVSLAKEEDCWSTVKLSGEIVEGADVEVRKLVLYYKELPQGYLPSDGIVPHFYWEGTIRVIPAELYV